MNKNFKIYIDGAYFHRVVGLHGLDSYKLDYPRLADLVKRRVPELSEYTCLEIVFYNGSVVQSEFIRNASKTPTESERYEALANREYMFMRLWENRKGGIPVRLVFLPLIKRHDSSVEPLKNLLKKIHKSKYRSIIREEISKLKFSWKQEGVDGKIIEEMSGDFRSGEISTVVFFGADSDFLHALSSMRERGCNIILLSTKDRKDGVKKLAALGAHRAPVFLAMKELRAMELPKPEGA